MERTLEIGEKKYKIDNNSIKINNFSLTPGEIPKIVNLLGIAGAMSSLKALPPEILNDPFSIEFKEDGNHELIRNFDGGSIPFTFEEIDEVINTLQMALDVSLDIQKISPKTIPQYQGPQSSDIIEGKG